MMFLDVVFWALAGLGVTSALAVVSQKDIFRAALFLIVTFLSVAGLFVLLNAEFLAMVQVLVYVGAISVLIIFAIMLTRNVYDGNQSNVSKKVSCPQLYSSVQTQHNSRQRKFMNPRHS